MQRLSIIPLILLVGFLGGCKERIFTDISVEFEKLEDVFPGEFYGETLELRRNEPNYRMNAKEYLLGIYGSQASLQAWEFTTPELAKNAFDQLEKQKKREVMRNFASQRSHEYRFDYTLENGEAGLIFTNKPFLFALEAKNYDRLTKFVKLAKIARIQ